MKPLLVSSGEPAGIGPDICLALAKYKLPIVVLGDRQLLALRAKELQLPIELIEYDGQSLENNKDNQLLIISTPCAAPVVTGRLNPQNADYVINMLTYAAEACLAGKFSALITAPVHKAVINDAGIAFTGHTEFLADYCGTETVVMMLAVKNLRVALMTTHLPLHAVPAAITQSLIVNVITQLNQSLMVDFGFVKPLIMVAGLNPHAGENGYLGFEEIEIIAPAIAQLQQQGINVQGPMPADTMFTHHHSLPVKAFVAMYHDQGLPVVKYAGFGEVVNISLGLPFIRTSVDHGTALELAGTGKAKADSLLAAIKLAASMTKKRSKLHDYN